MTASDQIEERRKKVTVRKIERKHAGKIVQPYAILERLIDEIPAFEPLKKAKFCLLWKSGWRTNKDGILVRAQIAKAGDDEREKYGAEYDYTIRLHKELWTLKSFSDVDREMDVFHELCHAAADLDEDGKQKVDERDRLVWRLRRGHPIQEFPEVIERYGLDKSIGVNAEALKALDDEEANREAQAAANDAKRPIVQQLDAKGPDAWKSQGISALKLTEKQREALLAADVRTLGELQVHMNRHGAFWPKHLNVNGRMQTPIEDAFNAYISANVPADAVLSDKAAETEKPTAA